jgi:predicted metal-dependent HD superfamily phosphohydrolase
MSDVVKAAWAALVGKYSTDPVMTEALWDELFKKYTSPRRHYHNLAHLEQMLALSRQYQSFLQDKDGVDFSIFYHDIIYNVLRKDNEQRSAALAFKRLKYLGLTDQQRETIKAYVEATHAHTIPDAMEGSTDLAFFLDFDMSILAADWPAYEVYTLQVRREYRLYPDRLYHTGRKQFLEKSLQEGDIFHTPVFKGRYEATARANMERELRLF